MQTGDMDQRTMFVQGVRNKDERRRPDLNNRILESMRGIGGHHMPHTELAHRPERSAFTGVRLEEDDAEQQHAAQQQQQHAAQQHAAQHAETAPTKQVHHVEYVYTRCKQNWGWIILLFVGLVVVVVAAVRSTMKCNN